MIPCETRDQLLREKDEAFQEWYSRRGELEQMISRRKQSEIGPARQEESKAKKRLSHAMSTIISHYQKHGCNKD
jgi:hypothetical protein